MEKWIFLNKEPNNLPEMYETVVILYHANTKHVKYQRIPGYITEYKQWMAWSKYPTFNEEIVLDNEKVTAWYSFPDYPEGYTKT